LGAQTSKVFHELDCRIGGADPLPTNSLTPAERLDEVARLLALGFLRLRARRSERKANDPNHLRKFGLDLAAERSVCDTDTRGDRKRR
jgi:hypothetical protein